MAALTYKSWLNRAIKAILFVVLTGVIYMHLQSELSDLSLLHGFKNQLKGANSLLFICIVLLIPLNWLLESSKWRSYMSLHIPMSISDAYKSILAGISLAILTPNRIGEYGGRMITVPSKYNWHSAIATFLSSVAQNLVTIFFGLAGLLYINHQFDLIEEINTVSIYSISLAFLLFGIYVFFNVDLLALIIKRLGVKKYFSAFRRHFKMISSTPRVVLYKILVFAAVRYCIYALQYYLAVLYFGVEISPLAAWASISTILFIQSGIPLPPFLSILARAEIALVVWGFFDINELIILSISFIIWLLNLAIPAIFGFVIIANRNILDSFGYGKD